MKKSQAEWLTGWQNMLIKVSFQQMARAVVFADVKRCRNWVEMKRQAEYKRKYWKSEERDRDRERETESAKNSMTRGLV